MAELELPCLWRDRDRHGNVRWYVARAGRRKVRIRGEPGSPEFLAAYTAAMADDGIGTPATVRPAHAGSLRWLLQRYVASAAFRQLAPSTRRVRRQILEGICAERFGVGASEPTHGDKPFGRLEPAHVRRIRDVKAGLPEAANGRVKALRQLYAFALEEDLVTANPARDVARLRNPSGGFHSWTVAEIRQYQAHWPLGTPARLALDVLLYTGARRSDAVTFGPQKVRTDTDGTAWLHWTETKGRTRRPKHSSVPVLPALQQSLAACPSGHLAWLVTSFGKPYTANGFGNRFRKWCDAAGLPHCSAHGLRKAGATIAAEGGATDRQLMAIFGWASASDATTYTRAADRRRLTAAAMALIALPDEEREGNAALPPGGKRTPTERKA